MTSVDKVGATSQHYLENKKHNIGLIITCQTVKCLGTSNFISLKRNVLKKWRLLWIIVALWRLYFLLYFSNPSKHFYFGSNFRTLMNHCPDDRLLSSNGTAVTLQTGRGLGQRIINSLKLPSVAILFSQESGTYPLDLLFRKCIIRKRGQQCVQNIWCYELGGICFTVKNPNLWIYHILSYQNPSYVADIRSKSFSGIKGLTTIPQYYILCNVYYYENCVYLRNGLLWRKSFVF